MFDGGARVPRIKGTNATINDIPNNDGKLSQDKLEKRLDYIHEGGHLQEEYEIFPDSRGCQDCFCIPIFCLLTFVILGLAVAFGGELTLKEMASTTPAPTLAPLLAPVVTAAPLAAAAAPLVPAAPLRLLQYYGSPTGVSPTGVKNTNTTSYWDPEDIQLGYIIPGCIAGAFVGFLAVVALIFMSKHFAKCVVYTSLLFSCVMMIFMGISLIGVGASMASTGFGIIYMIFGALMIFMGLCMGTCILCCWFRLIEFTAHVVEVCGTVTLENCGMFFVSLLTGIKSAIWSILVGIAMVGTVAAFQSTVFSSKYIGYAVFGAFFFAWIWGILLFSAIAYTTFCGVFGRWYYSNERPDLYDAPLCPSFFAAAFTSLGSIIFGTGLVAAVRTAEFVARMCQEDAAREGNIVMCLLLCCVRCVLQCIGDIIEFVNEWAYVQCAIRNTSYCESAKIVFSMCTLANIPHIFASLLIESVVNFGSFLAGILCGAICAGIGYIGSPQTALVGFIVGLIGGQGVGWCCMSVFTAGAKTLLTCWAEKPDTLFRKSDETDIGQKFLEQSQFGR